MTVPTIVTVDSSVDTVTQLGQAHREQLLLSNLRPPVANLVRCQNNSAVRFIVANAAAQPGVSMLMGIGHGQGNVFSGAGRLPVYQVGQYADAEVNGRVIHWTACDTAQVLGPDMVARGARAFFGYIEDIIFPPQLAQIIFDCDAEIDRALVQGSTTAQAQQRAIGRFNSYIDALRRRNPSDFLIPWVELNRDRLRGPLNGSIFGDGETRIT